MLEGGLAPVVILEQVNLSDFDYPLPAELIAQEPLADRTASRMLVVDRAAGTWKDRSFRELPEFLSPGDCLVLNDSKVIPCRLLGELEGRAVEVFLLRPISADRRTWHALGKPGKRLRPGVVVQFSGALQVEVLEMGARGERTVRLHSASDVDAALEAAGHVPLPPYIHRSDRNEDRARYQTVYATQPGSVAAPTAGLHFTEDVLRQCAAAGTSVARVTLHVGLGTFQPLPSDHVESNHLHSEWFEVPGQTADAVGSARRVVAVGTTSARVLESAAQAGRIEAGAGETNLFIYPGYSFQVVGAMVTNFHLPKSSLLLLVSALAGRDLMMAAYRHAVRERYRFFSYGDCMLIV